MQMIKKKANILYVEDDVYLSYVTCDNLEQNGYSVKHCLDGESAIEAFNTIKFDICILDVMLPKLDGFTLAKKIRETNKNVPIIFLSAKSMKEDRINGLLLGGDDYITKPFSIEELILKIEVFLKRSKINLEDFNETHCHEIGEYCFDFPNLQLVYKDKKYVLTAKEADLLRYFCSNVNKILKREDILNAVWGGDDYYLSRSLDVFISRLRKYLNHDKNITIKNVHGVGFKLMVK